MSMIPTPVPQQPVPQQPLGGLDLTALAQQAGAETQTRVNTGQDLLAAALQSVLNDQQGALTAGTQQQDRSQVFDHAQAILAEALSRREETMREAQALAQQRMDEIQAQAGRESTSRISAADRAAAAQQQSLRNAASSSGSGYDPYYDHARFATDENIRQAIALQALEPKKPVNDGRPHLSDFLNPSTINPYRGLALLDYAKAHPQNDGNKWRTPISQKEMDKTRGLVKKYGVSDPAKLIEEMRKVFGEHRGSSGRASIALWNAGYAPQQ